MPAERVLVLAPLPEAVLAPLRGRLDVVEAWAAPPALPDPAVIAFTIGNRPLTRAMVAGLPALRYVCHYGTGTDLLALDALRERGVLVTNTAGAGADCVADLGAALLLALIRRLLQGDRLVRGGGWAGGLAPAVGGRRVGIYGLGAIGGGIARRLAAFGAEIGHHSRSPRPEVPYRAFPSLTALADWAEDLVVTVAATPGTVGSVDAQVLAALGPGGRLVNVARGVIVDEPALIAALREGRLAGAGLDTFENEPAIREDFRHLDNVILSPHTAAHTPRAIQATNAMFLANLERWLAGEEPRNVVA